MNEAALRKSLVDLLIGSHAHVGVKRAFARIPRAQRAVRPADGLHSVWEELEHMRLAQEDIVRYTLDPSWRSPEFPSGYWPAEREEVTDDEWAASLNGFVAGLEETRLLAQDPGRDLTARIPHGEGRTYLRQILLVADHNAYHLGQVVQIRKALGNWPDREGTST
jgi:uncharacterized damage-inducible protein DinB